MPCQFLTSQFIRYVKENSNKYEKFAVGVYSDQLIEQLIKKPIITKFEDRLVLANAVKGVDFVFPVPTLDFNIIEYRLKEEYKKHLKSIRHKDGDKNNKKKYKVGYVPGTYDLLHAGHIENLQIARAECEILVGGVNDLTAITGKSADNIVMSTEERAEILEGLKIIDHVLIAKSSNKSEANNWIKQNISLDGIEVIYAGTDRNNGKYCPEFKTIFTERPPHKMEARSSSTIRKKLEIHGYTTLENRTFTRTVHEKNNEQKGKNNKTR